MQVVTAREFRSSQGKYLNAAKRGESLTLRSRFGDFSISPMCSNENTVKSDLKSSFREIKSYLAGEIDLPLAENLKF